MKALQILIAITSMLGLVLSEPIPQECLQSPKIDLLDPKLFEKVRGWCAHSNWTYSYSPNVNLCYKVAPMNPQDCEILTIANTHPVQPRFESLEECVRKCVAPNKDMLLAPLQKFVQQLNF